MYFQRVSFQFAPLIMTWFDLDDVIEAESVYIFRVRVTRLRIFFRFNNQRAMPQRTEQRDAKSTQFRFLKYSLGMIVCSPCEKSLKAIIVKVEKGLH